MQLRRPWHVLVLLLLCSFVLSACGSGQRQDTLRAALVTFKGIRDGMHAWDRKHQDRIIDAAKERKLTRAEVTAELVKYWEARNPLVESFVEVVTFLFVAANEDTDTTLKQALDSIQTLATNVANFQKLHEGSP